MQGEQLLKSGGHSASLDEANKYRGQYIRNCIYFAKYLKYRKSDQIHKPPNGFDNEGWPKRENFEHCLGLPNNRKAQLGLNDSTP